MKPRFETAKDIADLLNNIEIADWLQKMASELTNAFDDVAVFTYDSASGLILLEPALD